MKNIDEKIKKLQEIKQQKIEMYQKVYDFINSIEVDKSLQSEFGSLVRLINNAIARRVTLPSQAQDTVANSEV